MRCFVVTHKPACTIRSSLYSVIAVGGAAVPDAEFRDDVGDNIAARNPSYCELTATYWIWKNSREDAVGLCHYRRYFNLLPTTAFHVPVLTLSSRDETAAKLLSHPGQAVAMQRLLEQYDIIVPRAAFHPRSVGDDYVRNHGEAEWDEFVRQLDLLYGADTHSIRDENRFYACNMLACRKEVFDRYATQLFQVIDPVYAAIGPRPDEVGARFQPGRYPGYLGERFMSAFLNANRLKYYEAQVVFVPDA